MSGKTYYGPIFQRAARKWGRFWTDVKMARKKAAHRRKIGPPARKTAAFVVGCQRSGTDVTIKTLDRSLDVDRFDEYDLRAFEDARIRDKSTRDRLIAASPAKCIIFKPVCDCHRAAELLADHPGSKVVWVFRSYQDVANSAVERWGDKTQRWVEDLLSGGGDWGSVQWNTEKVTDECLAEVRQACAGGLTPHGAAVIFWYMRNRTFFEQGLENNPDAVLVRYENLVGNPQGEFTRLCEFLDIGFYPEMVDRVFRTSVRKREFPEVAPPIRELCDSMMGRLEGAQVSAP